MRETSFPLARKWTAFVLALTFAAPQAAGNPACLEPYRGISRFGSRAVRLNGDSAHLRQRADEYLAAAEGGHDGPRAMAAAEALLKDLGVATTKREVNNDFNYDAHSDGVFAGAELVLTPSKETKIGRIAAFFQEKYGITLIYSPDVTVAGTSNAAWQPGTRTLFVNNRFLVEPTFNLSVRHEKVHLDFTVKQEKGEPSPFYLTVSQVEGSTLGKALLGAEEREGIFATYPQGFSAEEAAAYAVETRRLATSARRERDPKVLARLYNEIWQSAKASATFARASEGAYRNSSGVVDAVTGQAKTRTELKFNRGGEKFLSIQLNAEPEFVAQDAGQRSGMGKGAYVSLQIETGPKPASAAHLKATFHDGRSRTEVLFYEKEIVDGLKALLNAKPAGKPDAAARLAIFTKYKNHPQAERMIQAELNQGVTVDTSALLGQLKQAMAEKAKPFGEIARTLGKVESDFAFANPMDGKAANPPPALPRLIEDAAGVPVAFLAGK